MQTIDVKGWRDDPAPNSRRPAQAPAPPAASAQVDTYWTDKTRVPDVFPPDAISATEVSLMAHTASNAVLEKAKSCGAWYYAGRHGVTTMAR